jgi:hypothetical protein
MEMLMSGSISPTFLIIYPLQPSLKVRFVTSAVGFLLDAIDYQLLTASFFFFIADLLFAWRTFTIS